ncbi:MAG: lipase family protein [Gordonia sp. (in: high G+C Gram-positive bacteria)]|jgi:pimeloyl-ACP methyl ester carboxylesterase|nr:lipase family protein [Gordonia sp. (in: high G+C Gram-positive bacteria)]
MMKRLALFAATVVVAASASTCLPAVGHAAPDGGGRLLTQHPLTSAAALPSASYTRAVTYTSTGAQGRPIVVSGIVAVPRGKAPRGGWPTISWAHGTTGYADVCAPSLDTATGPSHAYLGPVTGALDTWIKRGFAVVATDYEGLGTPGGHPYINGTSEANTVADIVKAGRSVDPRIGREWIVAGHSQGGQAALFTAQQGAARQPSLRLKGAIALAPGGVGLSRTVDFVRSGQPGAEAAESFLPLIVLGANAAQPGINPSTIFSDKMAPMVDAARASSCLTQLRGMPAVAPAEVFRSGADFTALSAYLNSQDPSRTSPRVPVLVAQGTADTLVGKAGTDSLVSTLCGRNASVDYRIYNGADHRAVVTDSIADAQTFADQVIKGAAPAGTC